MENLSYKTYQCEHCGVHEHEDIGSWNKEPYLFFCSEQCHELWDEVFKRPKVKLDELKSLLDLVDNDYFDLEDSNPDEDWTFGEIAGRLATYCYDCDASFDEESLNIFNRIAHAFGEDMRQQVMLNLFNRNHDT